MDFIYVINSISAIFPQVAPVFLDLILERGLLGDNETLPACRLKRFLKEEHKV